MTGGGLGRGAEGAAIGVLLIILGVFFMIDHTLGLELAQFTWPVFILAAGAALLAIGLAPGRGTAEWAVTPGSLLLTAGLILLYQNATGHWQSWAYAWALVVPGSIGAGKIITGLVKGRGDSTRSGIRLFLSGVIMFLAGAFFFELVVGISGYGIKNIDNFWPVLLIALGAWILYKNLRSRA